MTQDNETAVPGSLGGGSLAGPMRALFDTVHERDEGRWEMPVMLAMVAAEHVAVTDEGHDAVAVMAGIADPVTEALNSGDEVADTLVGLCAALRENPRPVGRSWLGLSESHVVIAAGLLSEMWAVPVNPNDPVQEAEVLAWMAAHDDEVKEHPDAVEVRTLLGVDIFGYMYRLRWTRGEDHGIYSTVPLPGLAGPGTHRDMQGMDLVHDYQTFTALGITLTTLARLTDPDGGAEW